MNADLTDLTDENGSEKDLSYPSESVQSVKSVFKKCLTQRTFKAAPAELAAWANKMFQIRFNPPDPPKSAFKKPLGSAVLVSCVP